MVNGLRAEPLPQQPYLGVWLQGVGEYGENGTTRRAAVGIGPQFGTVGPEFIREAAKEAVKFADLLVACGFAFDPLAGEETTELGRLTMLRTPISPDQPMGDFNVWREPVLTVFGEVDMVTELA